MRHALLVTLALVCTASVVDAQQDPSTGPWQTYDTSTG